YAPQLESLGGQGMVAQGAEPVQVPRSKKSESLNAFEKLCVQAKFTIGETAAYSRREITYLISLLQQSPEMETLFQTHFQPRSKLAYTGSLLEACFKEAFALRREQEFKQAQEITIKPSVPSREYIPFDYSTNYPISTDYRAPQPII